MSTIFELCNPLVLTIVGTSEFHYINGGKNGSEMPKGIRGTKMPNVLDDRKKTATALADAITVIDDIYQDRNNTAIVDALLLVVLNVLRDAEEHTKKEVKEWTIYYKKREFADKLEEEMNREEEDNDEE